VCVCVCVLNNGHLNVTVTDQVITVS